VFAGHSFQTVPKTVESKSSAIPRHDLKLPQKLAATIDPVTPGFNITDCRSITKSSTFDSTPLIGSANTFAFGETRFPPVWMKRSAKHTVCAKAQEAGSVKNH